MSNCPPLGYKGSHNLFVFKRPPHLSLNPNKPPDHTITAYLRTQCPISMYSRPPYLLFTNTYIFLYHINPHFSPVRVSILGRDFVRPLLTPYAQKPGPVSRRLGPWSLGGLCDTTDDRRHLTRRPARAHFVIYSIPRIKGRRWFMHARLPRLPSAHLLPS